MSTCVGLFLGVGYFFTTPHFTFQTFRGRGSVDIHRPLFASPTSALPVFRRTFVCMLEFNRRPVEFYLDIHILNAKTIGLPVSDSLGSAVAPGVRVIYSRSLLRLAKTRQLHYT